MTTTEVLTKTLQKFYGGMLSYGRNSRRENILHYVCSHNLYKLLIPLLKNYKFGKICEQDIEGRTPIHTAIEGYNHECIEIFKILLANHHKLREGIQQDLRRIFQIYNNNGHTILHEAVLHDMQDLVRVMLKFCHENDDDELISLEVLGSGDTILHLVVRTNSLQMAEILCTALPDLKFYGNYAGVLPHNLCDITNDMDKILRRKQ
ncbi:uncharacterized protein LOC142238051 [Haematobia irritans]|uniref:uncharacterized protein LOC142238051 n=1 Tax=Haematobia irritans TaxID=7368 RepID=UPI003F504C85